MADTLTPLILDMLEWLAVGPRPYAEVMLVWRTSCPRLPVWEDALERGFVERRSVSGRGLLVQLTPLGSAFLESARRGSRRGDSEGSGVEGSVRSGPGTTA